MTLENMKSMGAKFLDKVVGSIKEKRQEEAREASGEELLSLIAEAKENVMIARNNFNFATDDKLLECRIFELKAAESRLGYFLKMAKEENVVNSSFIFAQNDEGSACL